LIGKEKEKREGVMVRFIDYAQGPPSPSSFGRWFSLARTETETGNNKAGAATGDG
jgi:hypothetical protein